MGKVSVTMRDQERLIRWAEPIIGVEPGRMPSETVALGVIDEADDLQAVICFNAFYSDYASLHLASNGRRRWLSRKVLRVVFGYAFEFRKLRRLNFVVSVNNIPVQVLALKLGLRIEGCTRCGANDGSDGILFGMLAEECPWVKQGEVKGNGKVSAEA